MAIKVTNKRTNYAKNKPNSQKRTQKVQKVNMQNVTLVKNGKKVTIKTSAREARTLKNAA